MFAVMPAPFHHGNGSGHGSFSSEYRTPALFRASGPDSNRGSTGLLHDPNVPDGTAQTFARKQQALVASEEIIREQTEDSNLNPAGEALWV